jgi:hypothetical protein
VHVTDLEPEFGFDVVFDHTIEVPPDSAVAGPPTIDRYLLRTGADKIHYDSYAHCTMSTTVHACVLNFSLDCDPAIGVSVHGWPFERMDEAFEIQRRVGQFVAGMIEKPKCNG